MEDYIELWDDYSIKFNEKLEVTMNGNWGKLDEDEQEIAALWKFVVDVYDGGFIQFFCNWGYEGYWYAMRGIQRMENYELLNLLHSTYMEVLDKFKEDTRLSEYWDIPQFLSEEEEEILNKVDEIIYNKEGEKLAKMSYQFYHDKLGKQV